MTPEKNIPIYPHSAAYAREHGELDQYRESRVANIGCKKMIEDSIRSHFDGWSLASDVTKETFEKYGRQRVLYVLANTIQCKDWDQRFSPENRRWAQSQSVVDDTNALGENRNYDFCVEAHPGLVNLFVIQARKDPVIEKPSVREQLKQSPPPSSSHRIQKSEPSR